MPYRKPEGPAFDMIADFPKYAEYRKACQAKKIKPVARRTYSNFRKDKKGHKASKLTTPDTPEVVYRDLETGKYMEHENDLTLGMTFAEYRLNRKGSATLQLVYDRKGGPR
jgi:hypothetical protein